MDIVGDRFCFACSQKNLVTLRKADPRENEPDYNGDNKAENTAFRTEESYADDKAKQYQTYCHCRQQQYGVSFVYSY